VLQPGGVYEELRRVGSLPAPCPLFHADADTLHATFDLPEPIDPAPGTWDYDDEPQPQLEFDLPSPPRRNSDTQTPIIPGQRITRTPEAPAPPAPVVPGSSVSTAPPVPPRAGNRPPP
jgi:hypothetical protein